MLNVYLNKKNQRFVNINSKMISLMDCSGWEGNFGHSTPIFFYNNSEQVILIKVDGE